MPKKIPEVIANRMFTNMFICMKCNSKIRANPASVKKGTIKCRRCGSKHLRLKAKERRGQKA